MAIDYTKETKKVLDEIQAVSKTRRYFPKVIAEDNQKLRDNLLIAYKNTLESNLIDLLNALLDWNDAGNQIFEEKTKTKCDRGLAGFSCEICANYDCESNPEGKA